MLGRCKRSGHKLASTQEPFKDHEIAGERVMAWNFAMETGPMMIRTLKRVSRGAPLMLAAALMAGACKASLAQGDADLEAPGLESFPAPVKRRRDAFSRNVRIFDGEKRRVSATVNVLVKDGAIARISESPIAVDVNAKVRTIAAGGRLLMPGLIDAHWHAFMAATPQIALMTADPNYLHLLAARRADRR